MNYCYLCNNSYPDARRNLGYVTCIECGERLARKQTHCIVPMNKSNYVVVSDLTVLRQLNPKRTD